jgi:hypothetical protein
MTGQDRAAQVGPQGGSRHTHGHDGPDHGPADSAGSAWHARELSASGYASDTGAADPRLAAALAGGARDAELVSAVRAARLLVPVVAESAETTENGDRPADNRADMAAVTLLAPDGQRALPVFSSLDALARWDPAARPVPVSAARAGQAAIAEGCDVVVIDLAGPASAVLRSSMVWALAQDQDWVPPHEDPFVATSVERAVADEDDVVAHEVEDGQPTGQGVLGVALTLRAGLAPEAVRALATRVGERLASDGELRARIDGLAFRIR